MNPGIMSVSASPEPAAPDPAKTSRVGGTSSTSSNTAARVEFATRRRVGPPKLFHALARSLGAPTTDTNLSPIVRPGGAPILDSIVAAPASNLVMVTTPGCGVWVHADGK